jgi:voltage-gated sodium channel
MSGFVKGAIQSLHSKFDHKAKNRQFNEAQAELKALTKKNSTNAHHADDVAKNTEHSRRKIRQSVAVQKQHHRAGGMTEALHKFDNFSDKLFTVTTSWAFEGCILSIVCIACVAAGLDTYGAVTTSQVLILETLTFGVFTLEFVLKVTSQGREPWRYFTGYNAAWNCFDFLILCGSSPAFGNARGIVATMRALRLLKILNFLSRHLPKLGLLLAGIMGGLDELASIMALCVIIFWIFSSFAMTWFGANDPFHWGTLGRSMVTSTSLMTNSWTSTFYISYFGCATYGHAETEIATCSESHSNYASSLLYYILFMVLSTVLLSMCIGSIAISMDTTVNYLQDERERQQYAQRRCVLWQI